MPVREEGIPRLVDGYQARGKYWFTKDELRKFAGEKEPALTKSLWRLERKGRVARMRRGFYVIVPLEYSIGGILPPPWFIDDLMRFRGRDYYVGLLSAAAMHGSSHQAPQVYQVIIPEVDREIVNRGVRIQFLKKSSMSVSPTVRIKTMTGSLRVSDPAVTAIDLVAYSKQVGGLDRVGVVLEELTASITPEMLVKAAETEGHLVFLQRLGWLLDLLGADHLADSLHHHLHERKPRYAPLDPGMPRRGFPNQPRWKLIVNTTVELER
jgi:predicted transcriptional regulator of viral defense system